MVDVPEECRAAGYDSLTLELAPGHWLWPYYVGHVRLLDEAAPPVEPAAQNEATLKDAPHGPDPS